MANLWLIIKQLYKGAATCRPFIILCLLLIGNSNHAQNLVSNPSFEDTSQCPLPQGGTPVSYCPGWYSPSKNTPDYFNSCANPSTIGVPNNYFDFQYPKSGNGYLGGVVYSEVNRDYFTNKLISPLKSDSLYCLAFYINATAKFGQNHLAINSFGVYFSIDSVWYDTYYTLPIVQQLQTNPSIIYTDTLEWVKLTFLYQAQGGERYMTIGNFKNDLNTDTINLISALPPGGDAYYFFDDFSLYECTPPPVLPTQVPNVFTPNNDNVNDVFTIQSLPPNSVLTIYNRWGNVVYHSNNYQNNWAGDDCIDGVYYYIVNTANGKQYKGTLTILR
jgi:gliding motility-associated-like protein